MPADKITAVCELFGDEIFAFMALENDPLIVAGVFIKVYNDETLNKACCNKLAELISSSGQLIQLCEWIKAHGETSEQVNVLLNNIKEKLSDLLAVETSLETLNQVFDLLPVDIFKGILSTPLIEKKLQSLTWIPAGKGNVLQKYMLLMPGLSPEKNTLIVALANKSLDKPNSMELAAQQLNDVQSIKGMLYPADSPISGKKRAALKDLWNGSEEATGKLVNIINTVNGMPALVELYKALEFKSEDETQPQFANIKKAFAKRMTQLLSTPVDVQTLFTELDDKMALEMFAEESFVQKLQLIASYFVLNAADGGEYAALAIMLKNMSADSQQLFFDKVLKVEAFLNSSAEATCSIKVCNEFLTGIKIKEQKQAAIKALREKSFFKSLAGSLKTYKEFLLYCDLVAQISKSESEFFAAETLANNENIVSRTGITHLNSIIASIKNTQELGRFIDALKNVFPLAVDTVINDNVFKNKVAALALSANRVPQKYYGNGDKNSSWRNTEIVGGEAAQQEQVAKALFDEFSQKYQENRKEHFVFGGLGRSNYVEKVMGKVSSSNETLTYTQKMNTILRHADKHKHSRTAYVVAKMQVMATEECEKERIDRRML